MAAPKKSSHSIDQSLKETGARVGKTLARSSHKMEETGRKARKLAHGVAETVSKPGRRIKASPLAPREGLPVEVQLGFLAGDIYGYLASNGQVPLEKLLGAMQQRGNTQAQIYGALGWLARENKIAFSGDGGLLFLK